MGGSGSRRVIASFIVILAVGLGTGSPASAHAVAADAVAVGGVETAGDFELHVAVGEPFGDLRYLPVTVGVVDAGDDEAATFTLDHVELTWTGGSGRTVTSTAVPSTDELGLYEAVIDTGEDRSGVLTVRGDAGVATGSLTLAAEASSLPGWIEPVVLASGAWTLPFAAWMLARVRRTWLRPVPGPSTEPASPATTQTRK